MILCVPIKIAYGMHFILLLTIADCVMATECTMTVLNQPSVMSAGPLGTGSLSNNEGLLEEAAAEEHKLPLSTYEDHAVWSDITQEFTDACLQLELGVLVHDAKLVLSVNL
jgi:hypothetical protein